MAHTQSAHRSIVINYINANCFTSRCETLYGEKMDKYFFKNKFYVYGIICIVCRIGRVAACRLKKRSDIFIVLSENKKMQ